MFGVFFLLIQGFTYYGSKGATITSPLYLLFRFLTVQPCCKVGVSEAPQIVGDM